MKAITLTQPWATLVAIGAKRFETRSWRTAYRGPLAIHAAHGFGPLKKYNAFRQLCEREPFASTLAAAGYAKAAHLPMGQIVAVAQLQMVASIFLGGLTWENPGDGPDGGIQHGPLPGEPEQRFGNYAEGRYAWWLVDVQRLATPIPARGALSVWDVPTEVEAQIKRQLLTGRA